MNETTSQKAVAVRDGGDVAVLSPPRLPYHQTIGERFGVDRVAWKALVEAVFPSATSTNSVVLALAYCKARNLDPMKKMVHIVPMWQKKRQLPNGQWEKGKMVDTVWPSIAELRVTAFRTGQYTGKDEIEFGPTEKRTFSVEFEKTSEETGEVTTTKKEITIEFPLWGRVTVYRLIGNGHTGRFVGPKLHWLEEYGRQRNTDMPNDMWARRPFDQFEKVVEAAALRCAFPEEIGNDYAAEEMDGKVIDAPTTSAAETRQETPTQQQSRTVQEVVPLQPVEEMPPDAGDPVADRGEPIEAEPPRDDPREEAPPVGDDPQQPSDLQWLQDVDKACATIFNDPTKTWQAIATYQTEHVLSQADKRPRDVYTKAMNLVNRWAQRAMDRAAAQ